MGNGLGALDLRRVCGGGGGLARVEGGFRVLGFVS